MVGLLSLSLSLSLSTLKSRQKEQTTFSGQLRSSNFRCYTADPNKRWELCEDLTCGKSEQFFSKELWIIPDHHRFSEPIVFLQRKDTGNERGYFSKSFAEYVEGFEANGTSQTFQSVLNPIILKTSTTSINCKKVKSGWALTSYMNWRPRIPMDWRLSWLILTQHNTSPITASSRSSVKFIDSIILPCIQVGSAEGYQLTVTGFSPSSSTLHDGMKHNNGMNFTTLWELLDDCFFTCWFFFEKLLERTRILANLQMTNDTDQ